jgi:4-hydroxy-tetrahydrodipicolinate reductase
MSMLKIGKWAIIGKGKTGHYLLEMIAPEDRLVFDSKNPATVEQLKMCQGAILFVNAEVFKQVAPLCLEAGIPCVIGTTGMSWGKDPFINEIKEKLIAQKITWVQSHNFALGMRLVHKMLAQLPLVKNLVGDNYHYKMREVHHVHKKDAPSGTALSWRKWIQEDHLPIVSDRQGEVIGDHFLQLEIAGERITIQHQALDRSIFARGAWWTMQELVRREGKLPAGILSFEEFIRLTTALSQN